MFMFYLIFSKKTNPNSTLTSTPTSASSLKRQSKSQRDIKKNSDKFKLIKTLLISRIWLELFAVVVVHTYLHYQC